MFIKFTGAATGTANLLNTAAVANFSGSGEPGSNTLAYIAEPYREIEDDADSILLQELLALREPPAKYDKTISAVHGSSYLPTAAAQATKRV